MDQVFPGGLGGIGTKEFGAKSFSYTSYISNFFKRNFFMVMLLNIKKHGFEGTDPRSGNRGGKYCLFQMDIEDLKHPDKRFQNFQFNVFNIGRLKHTYKLINNLFCPVPG